MFLKDQHFLRCHFRPVMGADAANHNRPQKFGDARKHSRHQCVLCSPSISHTHLVDSLLCVIGQVCVDLSADSARYNPQQLQADID